MGRFLTRGHPAATAAVGAMVAGHAPHALLLAGPPGVGKTTLALDLAAGLLCTAPDRRTGRAGSAGAAASSSTAATPTSTGSPRPGRATGPDRRPAEPRAGHGPPAISDLALLPVEGGARVAIVERADRLNEDAQSALLKTLEEPPSGRHDRPLRRPRRPAAADGPLALRPRPPGPGRDPRDRGLLEDAGAADAARAARLARLAAAGPGQP